MKRSMRSKIKSQILKTSLFDLDRTLLQTSSSFQFCKYLYRKKVFSAKFLIFSVWYRFRFEFLGLSLEALHRGIFNKLLRGLSLQVLKEHVPPFLEELLKWAVYSPAFAELKKAKEKGEKTLILSNSPDFLVGPIANFFGVDGWGATEYRVDKDGCLCNISVLMDGAAKAAFLEEVRREEKVAKEDITVYTDSHFDLPLLYACGNQVAVNPDRKLRKIAKKQNWRVI